MITPNQERMDAFMAAYRPALVEAITNYPQEYCFPVSESDRVANRMQDALVRGSYNKDGRAIKSACKSLGIKRTYTGITRLQAVQAAV